MDSKLFFSHDALLRWSIGLVSFSLPFRILPNNVAILFLIIVTLSDKEFYAGFLSVFTSRKKVFLALIGLYIIHVAGVLWTENRSLGNFDLEKKSGLFIFPVLLLLNQRVDRKCLEMALYSFLAACFIEITVCFIYAIHFCAFVDQFVWDNFIRDALIRPVEDWTHPTDLAMYLLFCTTIIVSYLHTKWKQLSVDNKLAHVLILVYFCLGIVLIASRTPLVLLFLLVFIYGIVLFKRVEKKAYLLGGAFVSFALIVYMGSNIKTIRDRFKEIFNDTYALPYGAHHNSTNIRMATFFCSYAIIKENTVFGVGTGDVQPNLDSCYRNADFSNILYRDSYNSHNQYLQTAVGLGIVGLGSLLLSFFYPLYHSVRKKEFLHLFFVFIFSFCCLTEAMLCYQKGIVFFGFFQSLFCANSDYYKVKNNFLGKRVID